MSSNNKPPHDNAAPRVPVKRTPRPRVLPLEQCAAATEKEACDFLRVSRVTLWRYRDKWGLRPFKIGRATRYRVDQLRAVHETLSAGTR